MTTHRSQSAMVSLSVHVAAIALLLILSRQMATNTLKPLFTPAVPLYAPRLVLTPLKSSAGGGGGLHQSLPATQGRLPKIGPQFVAPVIQLPDRQPKLAMEPTVESAPDMVASQFQNIGDPLSHYIGASAGPGGPLGIGNGPGTGIGNKRGPGAGDGDGTTGKAYGPGKGIVMPVLMTKVEPEFSEEARKAKHAGMVVLRIDVDAAGHPRNIRVVQSLGLGLDEKAAEAVSKWTFKPGTKDGKPVPVTALVEVMFHLL